MVSYDEPIYGFFGERVCRRVYINLHTVFCEGNQTKTIPVCFLVVEAHTSYNVLLGRPSLNTLGAFRGVNLASSPWASPGPLFIKLPFRGPRNEGEKKKPPTTRTKPDDPNGPDELERSNDPNGSNDLDGPYNENGPDDLGRPNDQNGPDDPDGPYDPDDPDGPNDPKSPDDLDEPYDKNRPNDSDRPDDTNDCVHVVGPVWIIGPVRVVDCVPFVGPIEYIGPVQVIGFVWIIRPVQVVGPV